MLSFTRKSNALTGSQFIDSVKHLSIIEREERILKEILDGNMPEFLKTFAQIKVNEGNDNLSYLVAKDYLCIGSDDDYVRMPMNPLTAQKICDHYDCMLPTRLMVDDIWNQSDIKLNPLPWGPPYDASMMSSERYLIHNQRIQKQGIDKNKLISGHKKDVVLTNKLHPNNKKKRVAIYGWIYPSGKVIQPLNPFTHEDTYADYSHGIRLVAKEAMLNHSPTSLIMVGKSDKYKLISDEGILNFTRY